MPATHYDHCMRLQEQLDAHEGSLDERIGMARMFLEGTVNPNFNSHIRFAHADRALQVADGLTLDSYVFPQREFGEIALKGMVPRVTCVRVDDRLIVTLPFFSSTILGPSQELEAGLVELEMEDSDVVLIPGETVARPIHTPVESLRYVKYAA